VGGAVFRQRFCWDCMGRFAMERIKVGKGRWFDIETATKFKAATYFDGHNHCDVNTKSQWHHEVLYRTAKGAWWLQTWSNYEGVNDTWNELSEAEAHAWLLNNDHDDAVPTAALADAET
jgi:hypothetical protein